jgi:hypothetical protein
MNHAYADESQQAKGYPMVVSRNVAQYGGSGKPTKDWHKELEQPEMERQPKDRARPGCPLMRPCTKAYRKSIHGHTESNQENLEKIHLNPPRDCRYGNWAR